MGEGAEIYSNCRKIVSSTNPNPISNPRFFCEKLHTARSQACKVEEDIGLFDLCLLA